MTLSDIAIRRPVFTIVVTMGLMVLGAMSLRSIGTDLFPDVNFPFVTVTTVYPGASPSEIESQVTKPLEDAVAGINDLDTVHSFSRESVSVVFVVFKLKANIDKAAQDVRERVAAVRSKLPTDVREPSIRRVDVGAAPILTMLASGPMSNEELRKITEDSVKPALERVTGVAAVDVIGGKDREIKVEVDRKKLDSLNLPLTAVIDKLRLENLSVPAGHFEQGPQEISVRLTGDMRTAEEVGRIIVATTQFGTQIPLSEIASVRDAFAETRTRIRSNGQETVAFEVIKQSGTNTIAVADGVNVRLEEIKKTLPKGYKMSLLIDQSVFIRENAHDVEESIVYGGLMAILVILLFMLDWRSTFISSLALPTSVITTFFVMDSFGFTLNMMTLLGLSLAIGLLIDDAVVVRESIFRHLEAGEPPDVAASKGTSEIALAVLATTLTIVAVFVPVAFMSGLVGQFFRQFGLTVSAAVLVSLFIAFTLDPMLSSKLAVTIDHNKKRAWLVRMLEAMHASVEEAYASLLTWTARHRFVTVIVAFGIFAGSMQLAKLMGNDFMSPEDRAQFVVNIEMPPGTSLDETARLSLPAEMKLLENKNIVTVYAKLGPGDEVNKVQWRVIAVPKTERAQNFESLKQDARNAIAATLPLAKVSVVPPPFIEGLPAGAPLMVQVRGSDLSLLERDAKAVELMLRSIPGAGDINLEYSPGKTEQTVQIDRQRAADLGVPIAMIARTLRAALEGEDAGQLRVEDNQRKEVKIHVRLRQEDRGALDKLLALTIATPKGFVPLSTIATIAPRAGPQVIERQDRTRQILVTCSPTTRSLGEVVADLEGKLATYTFSGDNHYRLDGMVKQMKESGEAMGMALALAIVFIYLILAAQFESFIHPLTIMLSLPLAFVGAFIGLFLSDNSISMGSNIGVILLMGLVTKNGILLVDAALQNQRDGKSAFDSVVEAGRRRLRPILMTSAAMVLGMLPTAIGNGPGSEFRAPMAIAVIGGVITSTILTLLVLPSVFLWFDSARGLFRKKEKPPMARASRPDDPFTTAVMPPFVLPPEDRKWGIAWLILAVGIGAFSSPAEARPPRTSTPPTVVQVPERAPDVLPSAPNGLTLADAIERAMRHNADLDIAQDRIGEAMAARQKIYGAFLPDIKAVGTYTHNSAEAVFDTGAFFTPFKAMLPKGFVAPAPTVIQRYNTVAGVLNVDETLFALTPILMARAAEAGVDAQRTALDAARREIAYRVSEVFYNAAGLDRLIAAAERALTLADQRIALADVRHSQGTEGDLPGLRAKVERARAQTDLVRAKQGRRQLLELLAILTGEPAPSEIASPAEVTLPPGKPADWTEEAIRGRPDILARRQALAATEAMVREAELRWAPIVTANGYLRWTDTKGFTGENWLWAVSANLVVPIFDRASRYLDLHERKQTLTRQRAELRKAEEELRVAVRQSVIDIETAQDVLQVATMQSDLARRSAVIVTQAQVAGTVTPLEVAEADTSLRLSEANEERERMNLSLAILKLRHLTGAVRPE